MQYLDAHEVTWPVEVAQQSTFQTEQVNAYLC